MRLFLLALVINWLWRPAKCPKVTNNFFPPLGKSHLLAKMAFLSLYPSTGQLLDLCWGTAGLAVRRVALWRRHPTRFETKCCVLRVSMSLPLLFCCTTRKKNIMSDRDKWMYVYTCRVKRTTTSGHCQTRQRPHVENEEKKHKKPSYETGAGFISLGSRGKKTRTMSRWNHA